MADLKTTLKEQIIKELNLEGMTPEDIEDSAPLFKDGLGLDSIDAIELVVIMDNFHGIKISDESTGREVLYSIDTMAAFIEKNNSEKN
jgi:acyl carrier protein